MRALFDQLPIGHDQDQVGVHDRAQPVGDDDRRAAQVSQVAVHQPLGDGVEGAGRLVQQQDARLLRQRARQGDPLALAARERRAAVGQRRGVAHRHAAMSAWMHASRAACSTIVERQRRVGQRDVLADRRAEQVRVLGDDADLPPHRMGFQPRQVDSVIRDATWFRRVQAQQQVRERRLARAGAADDRHLLAGLDLQGHVAHHQRRRGGCSGRRRPRRGCDRASDQPRGLNWPCCSRGVSRTSLMRSM